jgi:hypothetical protein
MQRIECGTLERFAEVVYLLATKGLTFEANADALTITLTGGY